jgi:hypothetical protein
MSTAKTETPSTDAPDASAEPANPADGQEEQPDPSTETPEGQQPDDETTPPWGDDFDAARAWTLVQNLRADLAKAKEKRQERDPDSDAKITAAETRATAAERALYVERALRKFPEVEDLVEFLTGDTEEEIAAKAERLASHGKPAGESTDNSGDAPSGKPQPALTPGHGGAEPDPFDPDAIAKRARRSR